MKILFSPIGGTDPISLDNWYDGAMLHICRELKIDKVIMYMSKEILQKHEADNRYVYCINKLAELQEREIEYQIIERPELTNVQEFDYFYNDFKKIIEQIVRGMAINDELFLNISSGTPAMKSGIAVLKTLEEYPCKLVQVITPTRKMNEHSHTNYDVEGLWECNNDNNEDHENRCKILNDLPTLSRIKKEEIIKKHIVTYDYAAAITVAKTINESERREYYGLLQVAYYRLLLDRAAIRELNVHNKRIHEELHLAEQYSDNRIYQDCFEYALSLQVKLNKEEYADFVRAITPLLVELMRLALKESCGIDINQYVDDNDGWRRDKLNGTDIEKILESAYKGFNYGHVNSDNLNNIIQNKSKNEELKNLSDELRSVEKTIRNDAAHQLRAITERDIEKTGFSGKQIMTRIKKMFNYAGAEIPKEAWNSYDRMNEEIMKKI